MWKWINQITKSNRFKLNSSSLSDIVLHACRQLIWILLRAFSVVNCNLQYQRGVGHNNRRERPDDMNSRRTNALNGQILWLCSWLIGLKCCTWLLFMYKIKLSVGIVESESLRSPVSTFGRQGLQTHRGYPVCWTSTMICYCFSVLTCSWPNVAIITKMDKKIKNDWMCQTQVSRTGISNYTLQILWDVITWSHIPEGLSIWQLCRRWRHRRLSLRQFCHQWWRGCRADDLLFSEYDIALVYTCTIYMSYTTFG